MSHHEPKSRPSHSMYLSRTLAPARGPRERGRGEAGLEAFNSIPQQDTDPQKPERGIIYLLQSKTQPAAHPISPRQAATLRAGASRCCLRGWAWRTDIVKHLLIGSVKEQSGGVFFHSFRGLSRGHRSCGEPRRSSARWCNNGSRTARSSSVRLQLSCSAVPPLCLKQGLVTGAGS